MPIDRPHFFDTVRPLFGGHMEASQVDGMEFLLSSWEAWAVKNVGLMPLAKWLAYAMATTFHETGRAMVPVREVGQGKGHPYGVPNRMNGQVYYGRGYVQLTDDYNYRAFGLRMGIPLYANPDLALKPGVAAAILFDGMAHGYFTGVRLGQFFGIAPSFDRPVQARAIINRLDKAQTVADYYAVFLPAIVHNTVALHPVA